MMWIVIFNLACLAVTLEFIYRAPEYDEHGVPVRRLRRVEHAAAPLPPIPVTHRPLETGSEAP